MAGLEKLLNAPVEDAPGSAGVEGEAAVPNAEELKLLCPKVLWPNAGFELKAGVEEEPKEGVVTGVAGAGVVEAVG